MIKPEVNDLIQSLWVECEQDLEHVLEELKNLEGDIEEEAAALVRHILKHGAEEFRDDF